ncbi:MAG: hypothetical protein ACK58Q_01420 [Chitinophagales bacterium]
MKKRNLIEEVDLYVESRSQTEKEKQEIRDYISLYKQNKLKPVMPRKSRVTSKKKTTI